MNRTNAGPLVTPAEAAARLRQHDRIVVAAHGNADGDAIGSTSALGYLLRALGKRFALYNATGVPDSLAWLTLPGPVYTRLNRIPFSPGLLVALDAGELWRLGQDLAGAFANVPSLNIDHHADNTLFGSLGNLVDGAAASTGEVIASLAKACDVPLSGGLAAGVYISLVSDTGSFSYGNTTPEVLDLVADMMRQGLDTAAVREQLDSQWTLARARLWGRLFQRVRLEDGGRIALCEVTAEDFADSGSGRADLELFAEQLRCFKGVRVGLLVREDYPGKLKISLRSRGRDNVRPVAKAFGGGGHVNAAGASINRPREEVVPELLRRIREMLQAGDQQPA